MIRTAFLFLLASATSVAAVEFNVPGGSISRFEISPATSIRLPEAAWSSTSPPIVEGAIRNRAIRITGSPQTTLQLLQPIREALVSDGYSEVYSCNDVICGGFDFRFQLDLLREPAMHVDLGDYRYLLMRNTSAATSEPHTVAIVTSRASDAGFVHITEVFDATPADLTAPDPSSATVVEDPTEGDAMIDVLIASGHIVLDDLDFGSGSDQLSDQDYTSLQSLAAWLATEPQARIVLVGHTDSVGSLEANTALSQRRAEAVRNRLTEIYGVATTQLEASGVGYLAARASNLTEDGRALNRRVEVVLLER
ncbi:MAG: OmpA family protein [Boseongicola sp.]|nr:MAG: OmpA family protein [Boseongicola sp.]